MGEARRSCLRTVFTDLMLLAVSLLIWGSVIIVYWIVFIPWQAWTYTSGTILMVLFTAVSWMTIW